MVILGAGFHFAFECNNRQIRTISYSITVTCWANLNTSLLLVWLACIILHNQELNHVSSEITFVIAIQTFLAISANNKAFSRWKFKTI